MPPPLATLGQVYLVSFDGLWHAQKVLTTFHYGLSTIAGAPTIDQIASQFIAKINTPGDLITKFLACCPNAYFLNNCWVQAIAPVRYRKFTQSIASSGTFPFNSLAANQASVCQRRGIQANKHNVGNVHVPYPTLDPAASNGTISAGLTAALVTFAPELALQQTDLSGNVMSPVLFPAKTLDITKVVPIVSTAVQLTIRTMRSRTVGHGR